MYDVKFGGNRKPETVSQEIKNRFRKSCIIEGKRFFHLLFQETSKHLILILLFCLKKKN